MQIFKFGGASVKDAQGVKNLAEIVSSHAAERVVVVVSAMGKITNKLEELVKQAHGGKDYSKELEWVKSYHRGVIKELGIELPERYIGFEKSLESALKDLSECEPMLAYDKVVPHGELMSTSIVEAYLSSKVNSVWYDARSVIRTDQYFTEANVDWVVTEKQIIQNLKPIAEESVVVTQGFIGSDLEGNSTTLGREGSDYTGAILAYCLNADGFTVWKDVPGILNADPRILDGTEQYEKLSYREVTEMTYYGAQVIHPKTLKPIAQKSIPLIVRSFLDKGKPGTTIASENTTKMIPCFIFKGNQLLVTAQVKDHSFMDEKKLGLILQVLDLLNIKINLMQNSALTFSFCIDNKEFKSKRIKELLNRDFILSFDSPLNLATIKNYTPDAFNKLPWNRSVIMEQKTSNNYQVLYR
ncbi:aspartate kinase [Ekhidna lutea]|uniref:Aspartokinase n=1 Tax=Ekhidna lutea TaxID=447679 RepID=A0A239JLI6_EKHLU|nr:aspartate kinase [Ekhidna lutea]SNT06705.1 aspartate kinase [Ekhidna lutea]